MGDEGTIAGGARPVITDGKVVQMKGRGQKAG